MIGKCVPCDTSIVRCLDTKQQLDWLNCRRTDPATPLEHAVVARVLHHRANPGDWHNGLSCNFKPLNPQNLQAWASFEGFEGASQPFARRPSGDNIVRAFGAQKNG